MGVVYVPGALQEKLEPMTLSPYCPQIKVYVTSEGNDYPHPYALI